MSDGKVGRPRKADKYGGHIAAAEDLIADRLPSLVENLFRLADGVNVKEVDDEGGVDYYTKPPDRQANQYLIDRIMDKPRQSVELGGEDGGPLKVVIEYADRDGEDAEAPPGPEEDPA